MTASQVDYDDPTIAQRCRQGAVTASAPVATEKLHFCNILSGQRGNRHGLRQLSHA